MQAVRNVLFLSAIFSTVKSSVAAVANCTDDELTTVRSTIPEYGKALGETCISGACSTGCVVAMTQLADLLPDCDNGAYDFHQMLADGVSGCSNSTSDTSSGGAGKDICSPAEVAITQTVISAYEDDFETTCLPDTCTPDCITLQTSIKDSIFDCIDPTVGISYMDGVNVAIASCEDITGSSLAADVAGSTGSESVSESVGSGNSAGSASSAPSTTGSSGAVVASISTLTAFGLVAAACIVV